MRARGATAAAIAALAVALGSPAASPAAVTLGVADLSSPSSGIAGAGGGVTFVNTVLPTAAGQASSPIDGVVVRYRIQSNVWGNHAIRVLRPVGGGAFDAVGTSQSSFIGGMGTFDDLPHEYPARLPISVGDQIGVDADFAGRLRNTVTGAQYGYWAPRHDDAAAPSAPTPGGGANTVILFNADVEPDIDRDGLGDETQDPCVATAERPCVCKGRPVTISGDDGDNTLRGTPGADVISGLWGRDRILGLEGDDVICGDRGRDRLIGGAGKDILAGGRGRDTLKGGKGRDMLQGGPGKDKQTQ